MRTTAVTTIPADLELTLLLAPAIRLSEEQLFEFCGLNRELRIEQTAQGDLIVMAPVGGEGSARNLELSMQLQQWAKRNGSGIAFDSSAGFRLPNGAMRSPDAAWVERDRLRRLPPAQRSRFLPLCPTFVIELRSPSDRLPTLLAKMLEYLGNGAMLGWLIDPIEQKAHVYRPGREIETLEKPATLTGDPELPGFVLELEEVWEPRW